MAEAKDDVWAKVRTRCKAGSAVGGSGGRGKNGAKKGGAAGLKAKVAAKRANSGNDDDDGDEPLEPKPNLDAFNPDATESEGFWARKSGFSDPNFHSWALVHATTPHLSKIWVLYYCVLVILAARTCTNIYTNAPLSLSLLPIAPH